MWWFFFKRAYALKITSFFLWYTFFFVSYSLTNRFLYRPCAEKASLLRIYRTHEPQNHSYIEMVRVRERQTMWTTCDICLSIDSYLNDMQNSILFIYLMDSINKKFLSLKPVATIKNLVLMTELRKQSPFSLKIIWKNGNFLCVICWNLNCWFQFQESEGFTHHISQSIPIQWTYST